MSAGAVAMAGWFVSDPRQSPLFDPLALSCCGTAWIHAAHVAAPITKYASLAFFITLPMIQTSGDCSDESIRSFKGPRLNPLATSSAILAVDAKVFGLEALWPMPWPLVSAGWLMAISRVAFASNWLSGVQLASDIFSPRQPQLLPTTGESRQNRRGGLGGVAADRGRPTSPSSYGLSAASTHLARGECGADQLPAVCSRTGAGLDPASRHRWFCGGLECGIAARSVDLPLASCAVVDVHHLQSAIEHLQHAPTARIIRSASWGNDHDCAEGQTRLAALASPTAPPADELPNAARRRLHASTRIYILPDLKRHTPS